MVVFACSHCGESVQKPKVEKHYLTKCRNRNPNLSCMDCFKDFLGQDYESHTKCITEEERYSGKGFVSKEKKGEKKQSVWVEMLQSVLDEQKDAPRNVLRIIETISKHNNTPRKKPKFINFVKNVCGNKTPPKDIDQAWDMISVKLADLSKPNQNNQKQNSNTETNGNAKIDTDSKQDMDNSQSENGDAEHEDMKPESEDMKPGSDVEVKKLSKKQMKEEKKRKKYEAELQRAEVAPPEVEEEDTQTKKGKKKKSKSESENGEQVVDKKNKNKKRKRLDTLAQEAIENGIDNIEIDPTKEKTAKKKLRVGEEEEADESVCLHDQNVARNDEQESKTDKFNWHEVIVSVLAKKDNEMQFKRLQKKVLGEYSEATGREVDDRIADKFIKKLKSAPNVRVDKNRVLLVQ